MKIVDLNVLVGAVNPWAEHHEETNEWLSRALSGGATLGFDWTVVVGFVRLATSKVLFETPMPPGAAIDLIETWLGRPSSTLVRPSARHLRSMADLLGAAGRAGNLVNDAHLAALAVEHRAEIVTFDSDFSRFPGVRWERPDPDALAP